MARSWMRPALAVLMSAAVAAPALAHVEPPPGGGCRLIRGAETPDNPDDDVSVCRQDVYFHKGSAPVGNLAATGQATLPSWDTTKPEGDLSEAGVYVSSSEADIFVEEGGTGGRAQWEGTFTGPIDTLGFRLYLRSPFNEAADGNTLPASITLQVDGEEVFDSYDTAAVDLAMAGPDHDIFRIDAAFHKLYDHLRLIGIDQSPEKEHTVRLGIAGWFFPGSESAFIYDADDAAAGLLFNLESTSMAGFTKIDPTL